MRLVSLVLVAAAVACGDVPLEQSGAGVRSVSQASLQQKAGALEDHHGPVLASSRTVAIYWGDQNVFAKDLKDAMTSLLGGFNGSSYLGIAEQYMHGAAISNSFGGSLIDTSAPPKVAPHASDLAAEVCNLVGTPDASTLYIFFTSNAPNISYCAWHNQATCNGVTFQVAYVPNQDLLPTCWPFTAKDLKCNTLTGGTVSAADCVAHEFMESVTDPHLDAWYDANHYEIADKCNFNYQACVTLGNGAVWQIQSQWSNAIGGCQQ